MRQDEHRLAHNALWPVELDQVLLADFRIGQYEGGLAHAVADSVFSAPRAALHDFSELGV